MECWDIYDLGSFTNGLQIYSVSFAFINWFIFSYNWTLTNFTLYRHANKHLRLPLTAPSKQRTNSNLPIFKSLANSPHRFFTSFPLLIHCVEHIIVLSSTPRLRYKWFLLGFADHQLQYVNDLCNCLVERNNKHKKVLQNKQLCKKVYNHLSSTHLYLI